jgi:hypothetical protein
MLTFSDVLHALGAVRQGVQIWPRQTDRCSTQCKSFQNVGSTRDATIEEDLDFSKDLGC